jgi:hypothetical protein
MSTTKPVDTPLSTEDAAGQMAHYGIRCVPVDYFHFREFRYTSLADALAQAQRQAERDGMDVQTR